MGLGQACLVEVGVPAEPRRNFLAVKRKLDDMVVKRKSLCFYGCEGTKLGVGTLKEKIVN